MRRQIRWFAIVGAVLVAITGVWIGRQVLPAQAAEPQSGAPTSAPAPEGNSTPRSVEVVAPQRMPMSRTLDVPATLEAFEQADLFAKASGYVAEVRVDIGDRVKAGDVIAVLDVPEMARELAEVQAQHAATQAAQKATQTRVAQVQQALAVARAQVRRYHAELTLKEATARRREELFTGQAIPQEQLDEARNQLEVARVDVDIAEAKIASAEADVADAEADQVVAAAEVEVAAARIEKVRTLMQYAQVVAPFDGVITRRLTDRGALVQAGTTSRTNPLFTLQCIDQLRVFIEVPEPDVAHVRTGAAATVKPYGLSGQALDSKVARIATALNPSTRTMRTEIDLTNVDGRLYSGMYAQVVLRLDERPNALTIPAAALLTEGKEAFVYTAKDDRAVRTPIKTGLDDGIRVEVTEGLAESDAVIVKGQGLVTPGAQVRPVVQGSPSGGKS